MAASATTPGMKRSDSIAESMPEALRQSRYHMKRCFAKYIEKGRRIMKLHHLMSEMEDVIDDKEERKGVLDGVLGYILCSTQVRLYIFTYIFVCVNLYVFFTNPLYFFWCNGYNLSLFNLNFAGSSCCSSPCSICHKTKSWILGICQS